jgi:hypothetical protein
MNRATLSGYTISDVSVTTFPKNILYYAGSSTSRKPVIKRLVNARISTEKPRDVSIHDAPSGAYLHDLAINPVNGKEVLAVMTNYDIVGLYHTMNGGKIWKAVEGNLTGVNKPDSPDAGPSIRSATIVPAKSGTIYLVGTSTGVYSTRTLNGQKTKWIQESPANKNGKPGIGYSVVEDITSRVSDGNVAVGTHGRGMFLGRFQGEMVTGNFPRIMINPAKGRAGDRVTITATNFKFSDNIAKNRVTFGGVQAEIVNAAPSTLVVIVPRGTLHPDAGNRMVQVHVLNPNGANPTGVSFTILPPQRNELRQNYPNPFTKGEETFIPISLQQTSDVTLIIYDVTGRRIDEPVKDKRYQAGTYNIPVHFNREASGIYIYQLIARPAGSRSKPFVKAKKFTYIK